ncbi:hypothetical protein ACJZ2D_003452 [Fusarium nematophilum]
MSAQGSPSGGPFLVEEDWLSWLHEHEDSPLRPTADLGDVLDNSADALGTDVSSADDIHQTRVSSLQTESWDRVLGPDPGSPSPSHHFASNCRLPFIQDASSLSLSGDYGAPSDSSAGSVSSVTSSTSPARPRRRRRKQAMRQKRNATREDGTTTEMESRRYQCTFCTDAFKTKHDWQRHETTMHLSLEQWKCSRFGPVIQRDGHSYCVFCEHSDPPADHPELHNYSACVAQPDEARLFRRKDHMRQHLRLFHRGCSFNDSMESWLSSIDEVKSRCGFCDAQMDTWAERQKHLAVHFRTGADMKEWKGGRGFDKQIDDLVENDMPVFLIGDQRRTMEPFSASRADHRTEASGLDNILVPPSSSEASPGLALNQMESSQSTHSYREVERLLLRYVSDEISQGRVPSDRQLQRKTSEIIYGPDNAWDPTWADNPQWLDMFRKKAGLVSLPLSGGRNAFVGYDAT